MPPLRPGLTLPLALLLALTLATACGQPLRGEPAGRAVIVGTVQAWPSPEAAADALAAAAGVPVRGASPLGARLYALTLDCADEAACDAAQQRLQARTDLVRSLQRDQRRRLPARPASATSS